jgi:hypothetical protein
LVSVPHNKFALGHGRKETVQGYIWDLEYVLCVKRGRKEETLEKRFEFSKGKEMRDGSSVLPGHVIILGGPSRLAEARRRQTGKLL